MAGEKPTPEIRLDQLTGLRTILSPARADRPFDFGNAAPDHLFTLNRIRVDRSDGLAGFESKLAGLRAARSGP